MEDWLRADGWNVSFDAAGTIDTTRKGSKIVVKTKRRTIKVSRASL